MKSSFTYKILSILLSLLVLFSSLSLTVEKHFCGDILIDVAIFSEPESCGPMDLSKNDQNAFVKKSCCKDEIDVIEGLSEITLNSFEDLDSVQQNLLFAYRISFTNLFKELEQPTIPHKDYEPPKLVKDIHLLDEVYLI